MGKAKSSRRRRGKQRRRHNPTTRPAGHKSPGGGTSEAVLSKNRNLLKRLKSIKVSERETACLAIVHLFDTANSQSVDAARALLQDGLMRALTPRLCDAVPSVRLHASGALRNLSRFGDAQVCSCLVQDDVLTPVIATLTQAVPLVAASAAAGTADMASAAQASGATSNSTVTVAALHAEQLVAVLLNLCEESERAVAAVSTPLLVQAILGWACGPHFPISLRTCCSQLLQTMSDSNPAFAALITQVPVVQTALAAAQNHADDLLIRIMLAGLICTVSIPTNNTEQIASVFGLVSQLCSAALTTPAPVIRSGSAAQAAESAAAEAKLVASIGAAASPAPTAANTLSAGAAAGAAAGSNALVAGTNEAEASALQEGEKMRRYLLCKSSALEVLTNCLFGIAMGPLADHFLQHLSGHMIGLIQQVAEAGAQHLSPSFGKSMHGLNHCSLIVSCRAFTCLAGAIPFANGAGAAARLSVAMWPEFMRMVRSVVGSPGAERAALCAALLKAMGALASHSAMSQNPVMLAGPEIELLSLILAQVVDPDVQAAVVYCLRAFAEVPNHSDSEHAAVAGFLQRALGSSDLGIYPMAEAIDLVIDMFSEDELYMSVWVSMGWEQFLTGFVSAFKKKVLAHRANRGGAATMQRSDEDGTIEEALQNAQAFLEYKKSR